MKLGRRRSSRATTPRAHESVLRARLGRGPLPAEDPLATTLDLRERLTIQNRLRVWEKLRDKFAQTALGEVCSTEDGEAAAKALAGQEGPCVVRPCTCGAIVTGEPHTLLCDRVGFLDTA